ncbi:MAG: peptide chain release factor 1 [Spirochaetales bacterium]|jgi:peptide chain release factor 1|nr:peptide chain release factor 1 [Spirochaetales bacterium]
MLDKLETMSQRNIELEELIGNPAVIADREKYKQLLQEHSALQDVLIEYNRYSKLLVETAEAEALIQQESDEEMLDMAKEEFAGLKDQVEKSEAKLKLLLVPKDPLDTKNIIMEIRAGTGGDEAALFAADLYRMYSRYSEVLNWKIEIMSANENDIGGFKEISFSVAGKNVFENLRYESGTHRVQRVPETESGGRIHTSAVTVAVLPEAEETDLQISPEDLRIDVYRSSGPGGQSVNTTDSAVRITYIPTGLVVICQDEKSQHKNKAKALRVLRARLYEAEETKRRLERDKTRKSQIGTGDRSQRIRTYNFPQNRITDHRINLSLYKLESVMQGELNELIDGLKMSATEAQLSSVE